MDILEKYYFLQKSWKLFWSVTSYWIVKVLHTKIMGHMLQFAIFFMLYKFQRFYKWNLWVRTWRKKFGIHILYKVLVFLAVNLRNCGCRSFYKFFIHFVTQSGFFINLVNYGINFHVWMINDVGIYLFVHNNNPPEEKCRKVGIYKEI